MKNHIILLSNAFYPNIGGIENSLHHLAKSYHKLGYKVDILVGDVNQVNEQCLPQFEVLDGINVHRFGVFNRNMRYPLVRSIMRFIDMRKKLKRLCDSNTLGIISRYHDTTVMAKIVCDVPVIYLVPGVVKEQDKPRNTFIGGGKRQYIKQWLRLCLHHFMQQFAFRKADSILVFSKNMKMQIEGCFQRLKPQIDITKPGVDCARFYPVDEDIKRSLKQTLNLPESGPILLGVGRLVTAKGFHHLIAALPYCPQATVVILGEGPERASLENLAVKLAVSDRVIFTGAVAEPNLYYQAADVFMMTSLYEPLGQIILEAIASGLPVIAFSKQAMVDTATEELLLDSQCMFIDNTSPIYLSNGINTLLNDALLRGQLSINGRKLAVDSFNWLSLADKLKTVLLTHLDA
jgi:glycosyltransferase involved in cell wall biosynthesis